MLTGKSYRRIELPHEPDEWIGVSYPSLLTLDLARQARLDKAIKMMPPELMQRMARSAEEAEAAADPDPRVTYDWRTVLQRCVKDWSYQVPVSDDAIDELDGATVSTIMAALFPPRRTDDERKNGYAASTTISTATELIPRSSGSSR